MKKISRRDFLRGSVAGAATMVVGSMIPGVAYAEEADGEVIASGEKYTATRTADGWIKVVNEGGATLGYSENSGITLIEDDGYAFKDMNGNGELDPYEDWRLSIEERAENAVSLMSIEEMAGLRINASILELGSDSGTSLAMDNGSGTVETYMTENGLRYLLVYPFSGMGNYMDWTAMAEWANSEQEVAEGSGIGLPAVLNCDHLRGNTTEMGEAATFDPEAVSEEYQAIAKAYRAIGVSMILGPQVDLSSDPRVLTANTWTEDPQLSVDMTQAMINAMQSTYDEDGNDLGWGTDSVVTQIKHFAANESVEAGRTYHSTVGKYTVYPGDAFETQLIPFVDGGFNLTGNTGQSSAVMITYTIPWNEEGDYLPGAMNSWLLSLLDEYGYNGLVSTDCLADSTGGFASLYDYDGSIADMTYSEQLATMFNAGIDQIMCLGYYTFDDVMDAYDLMVAENGEEETNANFERAALHAVLPMFETGEVENPYVSTSDAAEIVGTCFYINESATGSEVTELAQKGIVMLKNSDGAICESTGETQTVYVPYVYSADTDSWSLPASEEALSQYFNVVTDSVDADGNIVKASDDEIASCDKAIVFIKNPSTGSGYDEETGEYYPISLQYGEYTADSEYVRQTSIAGDSEKVETQSPYGVVVTGGNENRSYYGHSTVASNLSDLELVQEVSGRMSEEADVVVCINSSGAMIFSELDEYADAILLIFGAGSMADVTNDNFLTIIAGEFEPTGLLPIQMPANMETVEAQYEDVPRDMECYVDSEGNTYDFAYGLNWSGVISDERTATYDVDVQMELTAQPVE